MAKIELPVERDLGQLIGDPFLFARQNFKVFVKAFLYCMVPPLLISVALSAFAMKDLFSGFGGGSLYGANRFSTTGLWASFGYAYLIFILVMTFQQIFVYEFMILYERNKEISMKDTLIGIKSDWKVILITLVAIIPIILTGGLISVFVVWASANFSKSVAGFLAFVLYLFLLYALIPLSNLLLVRMRERLGIFRALVKCFQITAGSWWKTFIAIFILIIIFYSLMLIMVLPFQLMSVLTLMHWPGGGSNMSEFFSGPILGIYLTIVSLWSGFLAYVLYIFFGINYFSLSERYDNYHLREQLLKIGERDETRGGKQEGEY